MLKKSFITAAIPLLLTGGVYAGETPFGDIYGLATGYCRTASAQSCVDRAWSHADQDRNGVLDAGEVRRIYESAEGWAQTTNGKNPPSERNGTLVTLMALKYAGLENVFARFDANADSRLTRQELFADFTLDDRSFSQMMADEKSVDWKSFSSRFGRLGVLIEGLVAGAGAQKTQRN